MKQDVLKGKTMAFAVRIVKLAKWLREERKEFALADQVLRSGTSIGANVSEAHYASSKRDFLNKCKIALKECAETLFWLELFANSGLVDSRQVQSMTTDCSELRRLLSATCKTAEKGLEEP
jgi:four helix bundle protein